MRLNSNATVIFSPLPSNVWFQKTQLRNASMPGRECETAPTSEPRLPATILSCSPIAAHAHRTLVGMKIQSRSLQRLNLLSTPKRRKSETSCALIRIGASSCNKRNCEDSGLFFTKPRHLICNVLPRSSYLARAKPTRLLPKSN